MKEETLITLIELLKNRVFYCDGFWILKNSDDELVVSHKEEIRSFIKAQGIKILERDIVTVFDELTHNIIEFDIDGYIRENISNMARVGKSSYFASLDKLYPNNKFREAMSYYLFHRDCYCFTFIGYGQTGKTTFVNIISRIIGEALSGRSNVAQLKGSHGTSLLEGKKFFEVCEAQDLDLDTANMLKSMITNDTIYVNPKFEHQRQFTPHLKMIMTCNSMPHFKVTDDGIIRRFIFVEMNKKIKKQNRDFMLQIEEDIPYIIYEALMHPFNIEDFAKEQYYIFDHDPQYGFGYGTPNLEYNYKNLATYDSYREMCRACGYIPRNKSNFDKFIELAKIYGERVKCDTTSKDSTEKSGANSSHHYDLGDLPF